ncbi:MAG: CarD family transcriptional regulator [Thermaerobacter sp.]|jgi:CarD family transcriptional regulator|nr:CarD family transcriptional regulator [Thermaerobacter sp.]
MFGVGDRVVYPMHGAGVIEGVEEREVLGMRQQYYVVRFPLGDMQVMVPVKSVREVGLRPVVEEAELERVEEILRRGEDVIVANWNQRYRTHLQKMKSGRIDEVAEVVRNLFLRERQKGLSTGERRMLDNARQILVSEVAMVKGMVEEQAARFIEAQIVS